MKRGLLVGLFIVACLQALAGGQHDHVLCFPPNFRTTVPPTALGSIPRTEQNPLLLQLTIGSVRSTQVHISAPSVKYDTTISLGERSTATLALPPSLVVANTTGISNNVVTVSSTEPISISALDAKFQSSESFSVQPVSALGTSYLVSSYTKLAADLTGLFCIVATEFGTTVTITGPSSSKLWDPSLAKGTTIKLNRGEVYTYVAPNNSAEFSDPSGTRIVASAPVAVISGHSCAYVPAKCMACNPLYEQLVPSLMFGVQTFIPPIAQRAESMVRVMASDEPATISVNGAAPITIPSGMWWEARRGNLPLHVTSDVPVQVALFGMGYLSGDSIGDPCMIMVPPHEQFAREQLITTSATPTWKHFLTLFCGPDNHNTVFVDGTAVSATSWVVDERSQFRYAHVSVPYGSHLVTSVGPVGVFVSGVGSMKLGDPNAYDAYGHSGAMIVKR